VRPEGLEPPAYWFEASRSIQLSYGRRGRATILTRATQPRAMVESAFAPARFSGAWHAKHSLGPVAQLAEQQTLNLRVVGSIPTRLTRFPNKNNRTVGSSCSLKP
jgi:hypothetical protein